MKKFYLGVDLGSTTSKAIIIDEKDEIVGRGITNTRANYTVAVEIARLAAIFNARFYLLKKQLGDEIEQRPEFKQYIEDIESVFEYLQFKKRSDLFLAALLKTANASFNGDIKSKVTHNIEKIFSTVKPKLKSEFIDGGLAKSNQFFRDIISEKYNEEIEKLDKELFEPMTLIYDKSITPVENEMVDFDFKELVYQSMGLLEEKYKKLAEKSAGKASVRFDAEINILTGNYENVSDSLKKHIDYIADFELTIANMVGTGYGRAILPFPKDSIKSEILCHAFGAHAVFPFTRTVLDIGGQDTKAIQVDKYGLVTSFNMNDRCAAGCGRYLGYIADEFSISLNELGPEALEAEKEAVICSTCTVFAGAEVREMLNMGEKRSNILAGLHKSIVMRAMSLIARSGGVKNEFTFTGGVARNQAVLKYVGQMVAENYGTDIKINIHTDSIFMGALGAAMFARRASLQKN
ncbi:MAG: benzoyl-CoA reductase subunit A [Chlorobi bacterium]|nr:benzoyl-CoA reductase subunit A [Chlorobiota bacterium]